MNDTNAVMNQPRTGLAVGGAALAASLVWLTPAVAVVALPKPIAG